MKGHCLLVTFALAGSAAAADYGPLEPFGNLKSTLELYRDGAWEPFAAGEYSMVRR